MASQQYGRIIEQTTSITTAGGTTTLTNTSQQNIRFTGSANQNLKLPVATTFTRNGAIFRVKNDSTGIITVQYDDASTLVLILPTESKEIVLFDNSTSNGVWGLFSGSASGSGTGLNWISTLDSNAEATAGAWAQYNDGASAVPVDGTGGTISGDLTWARTTTTPLNGLGSYLLSKTNTTNFQGYGFSLSSVAVPLGYRGTNHKLSFVHKVASGTYANGDIRIYAYDQTNSSLIVPLSVDLSIVDGQYQVEIPINSTTASVRIIIHIASTSTADYSLEFDDFIFAPADPAQFSGVAAMKASQAVFAIADVTEVTINPNTVIFDTDSAYDSTTGEYTVQDAGVYRVSAMLYNGGTLTANTGAIEMYLELDGVKQSYVVNSIGASTADGCAIVSLIRATSGQVIRARAYQGNGASRNFVAEVTIDKCSGHSTNQAIVVHASLTSVSITASTTIGGWTKIRDTQEILDASTGQITIKSPGDYFIAVNIAASSTNDVMIVKVNGTSVLSQQVGDVGNGFTGAHGIVPGLQIGDVVTVQKGLSGTTTADPTENTLSFFKINDVSENAPVAVIVDSSSTTLTSGGDTIVATNITKDTSNSFSGGTLTAPVSGFYQVNMYLQGSSVSYTAGDVLSSYVEANAVVVPLGVVRVQVTGTHNLVTGGSQTVYVLAGQTIVFKGQSSTSTSIGAFYGSIIKVG